MIDCGLSITPFLLCHKIYFMVTNSTCFFSHITIGITVGRVFGKLREYELELGRLKDEEKVDKKKKKVILKDKHFTS